MNIEEHKWSDIAVVLRHQNDTAVCLGTNKADWVGIYRLDAIAIAKHFKLTAEDINCPMLKAKQEELNEADLRHFDEIAELKSKISELEKRLKNIKWKVC